MARDGKVIDFIIIGGGIAGISAAARLAPLGKVLVLEAEDQLAYHTSSRSAALYEKNYGAPSVCALSEAGEDHFTSANGGVLSPRGVLLLCKPGTEPEFDSDMKALSLDEIDMTTARDMVPILASDIYRAGHSDSARDIDTDLLIQNFAKDVTSNYGDILTTQKVTKLVRTSTGWDVSTKTQTLAARHIVNAAGAWADQIAQMAGLPEIGLTPLRRSVARIAAPAGLDVTQWPMMFGPGESWYAKPDAGALIVSPANETPSVPMDAWPEDMELAEGLAAYQEHVTELVTRPIASWAGLRTFAADRTLVLGPSKPDPSFIWCAGQGGYGFQTAPGASRFLADVIAGKQHALGNETAAALSPDRFR